MVDYKAIWKEINAARTSTTYKSNRISVTNSITFKPLSLSRQKIINDIIMLEEKNAYRVNCSDGLTDLKTVKERSSKLVPLILNSYKSSKPVTTSVRDAIGNIPSMSGVPGQDPTTINMATPNIYISPYEASTIYSQKGLPETIINKKGKSPLLNGVKIKNKKLSPQQHDLIKLDMIKNNFADRIVEGIIQSLIYGGALMFPIFKKDSPVTTHLPIELLLKYGVIGKDCIDHWVILDRWNTVHIPNWNPTSSDFLYPKNYYIPFLGSHVSGERCARIITAPQPGYWAVLMTLGWGISDIPGWIESVFNYYNVMSAIPTMINQMSILVRTINVDSYMATEGMDILHNIDFDNTVKIREASINNPISMDVIGDVKALQRDFKEVPNLVRLVRQDVGGRANIPEELLWSTERGAFSSGDPTEGAQEKQWESIKYVHKTVASQLKNIVMLEVINALGTDNEVLSALPYTTIEFDNPIIANAEARAKIGNLLSAMNLDNTASGFPLDVVMELMQSYGDEEFTVRSDIFDDLRNRQAEIDEYDDRKKKLELEKLEAEIESIKTGAKNSFSSSGESTGYTKLEQKQKERSRGTMARRQGLQKAANKKLV